MVDTAAARPQLSRRVHLGTVGFGSWLILGLSVDGWAHTNGRPETFFTPWHGLFYSGFLATAWWMIWQASRHRPVPVGYGLGMVAVAIFAMGGVADLIWHQIFGIEVDLEALFSPSHLVLFSGALLIVTSPLRAAWHDPASLAPTFGEFLPTLLSATLTAATVSFILLPFSPFLTGAGSAGIYHFLAMESEMGRADGWMVEAIQKVGLASFLITTLVLMAPLLMLARRWRLPFGTFTVLLGTVAVLMSGIGAFELAPIALAAVIAGLVGDVLTGMLRPSSSRPGAFWPLAGAVPAALWLAYFILTAVFDELGWSVELWAGIAAMSAMAGFALALLMVPPVSPRFAGEIPSDSPMEIGA